MGLIGKIFLGIAAIVLILILAIGAGTYYAVSSTLDDIYIHSDETGNYAIYLTDTGKSVVYEYAAPNEITELGMTIIENGIIHFTRYGKSESSAYATISSDKRTLTVTGTFAEKTYSQTAFSSKTVKGFFFGV